MFARPEYGSGGNSTLSGGQGVDRGNAPLACDDGVSLIQVALELGMHGQPWQCGAWHQQELCSGIAQCFELDNRFVSAHVSVVGCDAASRPRKGLGWAITER